MTLRYKLFGIPGNLEELLNIEKTSVIITVNAGTNWYGLAYEFWITCQSATTGREINLDHYRSYVDVIQKHEDKKLKNFKKRVLNDLNERYIRRIQEMGVKIEYDGDFKDLGIGAPKEEKEESSQPKPLEIIDPWKVDIKELENVAYGGKR